MWVELPEGIDVAALETAAGDRGVQLVKGTDFLLDGGENSMRLAYSGVTPAEIDEGITRLAEAYPAEAGGSARSRSSSGSSARHFDPLMRASSRRSRRPWAWSASSSAASSWSSRHA